MAQNQGSLTPCDVISYAAPFGIKEVVWTAKRSGKPPQKPDPNPTDTNLVLHSYVFTPLSKTLQEDGITHDYVQSGYYVYICLKPISPTDGYKLGAPDFDAATMETSMSSEFVQGII